MVNFQGLAMWLMANEIIVSTPVKLGSSLWDLVLTQTLQDILSGEYLWYNNVKFCDRVANFKCIFLKDALT